MHTSVGLLLFVALMLQVSSACVDEQLVTSRHLQSDEYFANAYGFTPENWNALYHQPSNAYYSPEYFSRYEGRTSLNDPQLNNLNQVKKYLTNGNVEQENNQSENRFLLGGLGVNLINTGLFNNRFTPISTWRPFQNLANRIPIMINPNFNNPINTFDSCKSPSGDEGICVPGNICSLFGGRPSGSCILGKVCCINAITTCGGTVTLNNTYWQSPSTPISSPSTCTLTVRMDTKLVEQAAKPICQVRLDFVSFTTAQPALGTCTDTFTVGGSTSSAPIICGDNTGQHMYLDVPSSAITPTDVQLMFNFAAGITSTRSWNIKIAMLPCGASYLAPKECLQYFTSAAGRVKSFNWQDVAGTTAPRQLNNQNYNICFRTEIVASKRATQMCVSVCPVTNGGNPFFITTVVKNPGEPVPDPPGSAAAQDQFAATYSSAGTTFVGPNAVTASCLYDFLLIAGAKSVDGSEADRYCGAALNPTTLGSAAATAPLTLAVPGGGVPTSVQVCTPVKPFKMTYQTDNTEAAVAVNAPTAPFVATSDTGIAGVNGNTGFCLDFQER